MVADRVGDIPDDERVSVLNLRGDLTQVCGNNSWWGYVVEMAGGINLAVDFTASTGPERN
ncbi:MAG: hypothetical protein ACK5KU_12170 [Beutenbergiaceae bacterium]